LQHVEDPLKVQHVCPELQQRPPKLSVQTWEAGQHRGNGCKTHVCPELQHASKEQFWALGQHVKSANVKQTCPLGQSIFEQHCRQNPLQFICPVGHTQPVPEQTPPVGHVAQVPLQLVWPEGQHCPWEQLPEQQSEFWVQVPPALTLQVPPQQVLPDVQVVPHAPQLSVSVWVLVQVPLHSVRPEGQAQVPLWQVSPPVQTFPQPPQFVVVVRSVQVPVRLLGQQPCPLPHPQTSALVLLWHTLPVAQQAVPTQVYPDAQQVKAADVPGWVRQATPPVCPQAHGPCLWAIHCV
jgi:hypothetical protein